MAAGSSYRTDNSAGCAAETVLLAQINLHTSHNVADALIKQNHTLNEIGTQVTKLSIEALEYNVEKAEHFLQIKEQIRSSSNPLLLKWKISIGEAR